MLLSEHLARSATKVMCLTTWPNLRVRNAAVSRQGGRPVQTAPLVSPARHLVHCYWRLAAASKAVSSSSPLLVDLPTGVPTRALDVEYTTLLLKDGSKQQAPAWLAVVDEQGVPLLKTYINPQVPNAQRTVGGVSYATFYSAPSLDTMRGQLQHLLDGCLLVGHGLRNDLAALGYEHPPELTFDTMTYPPFTSSSGSARSLKKLAAQHLGWDIQQGYTAAGGQWSSTASAIGAVSQKGQRQWRNDPLQPAGVRNSNSSRSKRSSKQRPDHDPEEDAAAVMALFQTVVRTSSFAGLVEQQTQQLLEQMQQHQAAVLKPPE